MIDLLLLTWNRLGYTQATWPLMLEHTNWDLVRRLLVFDDNSSDGTRRWLEGRLFDVTVPAELNVGRELRSPVRTMLEYLDYHCDGPGDPDVFAKLDNDIVVPPGWLDRMVSVMERHSDLELLGMEAGMAQGCGMPRPPADPLALQPEEYTWVESSHIGGVGLMRTSAFRTRARPRPMGRFGFTEWQHTEYPVRGWIAPDLLTCDLSKRPGQPWEHLSWEYVAKGWERPWPTQHGMDTVYWDWWDRMAA